jgi:limonene-1,2-epoxide hydrolase
MRALGLLPLLLALAGPAGATLSPAAVVRAWSSALDRNDNQAAANLFARKAVVSQPGYVYVLKTHKQAVDWNSGFPCGARITSLRVSGTAARADFVLAQRPRHKCGGPGEAAAVLFKVRDGKIVRWEEVAPVAA